MMKNTARTHSALNALSTAGVLPSHGPSSKVSTTSLGFRKSYCLKCSKPKPGAPVVSISTVRDTPSALGLAQAGAATFGAAGNALAAGLAAGCAATGVACAGAAAA